jgi:hypothetical protein
VLRTGQELQVTGCEIQQVETVDQRDDGAATAVAEPERPDP